MPSARLFNGAQAVAGAGLVALALTRGSLSIAPAAMLLGGLGMAVTGLYYTVTGEYAGSEPVASCCLSGPDSSFRRLAPEPEA